MTDREQSLIVKLKEVMDGIRWNEERRKEYSNTFRAAQNGLDKCHQNIEELEIKYNELKTELLMIE